MDENQIRDRLNAIEECTDQAKGSLKPDTPAELRQSVEQLHQVARTVRNTPHRDAVLQVEECADRAMQACRNAGGNVDPQLQQAIQKAHAEASSLKKQVQMGEQAV